MIKFQLLATEVGNTNKTVGSRRENWFPSMAGLLGYRPSQYVAQITVPRITPFIPCNTRPGPFLTEQSRTRPPRSWLQTNCPHSRNIKGPLDRDKSCSPVGATHEALLHLPCFSHSRLMRLEAAITFKEHITQNAHRPPDDGLKAFHPYKFVPGSNETEGIISLDSFWNQPQS